MKTTLLTAAILLAVLGPGMAMADDECNVPMAKWQPREAVEQMARTHGWTVRRIKIDDGCYEIKGEDGSGRAIKVKLDPGSLAVIRVKSKDGEDNGDRHKRDDQRGDLSGPGAVTAPTAAPSPSRLFQGGAVPKVEVQ